MNRAPANQHTVFDTNGDFVGVLNLAQPIVEGGSIKLQYKPDCSDNILEGYVVLKRVEFLDTFGILMIYYNINVTLLSDEDIRSILRHFSFVSDLYRKTYLKEMDL